MIFLQVAITSMLVNFLAGRMTIKGMHRAAYAQATGQKVEPPRWSALIVIVSYWTAIIAGFSFLWSIPAYF